MLAGGEGAPLERVRHGLVVQPEARGAGEGADGQVRGEGGLTALTLHMACEYGAQGIRANCVAPGVTMTDMVRERLNDKAFRRANIGTTPNTRLGTVDDVASTIAGARRDDAQAQAVAA